MFKDENRHYSLRKLSVGLASVLIGISFASSMNSSSVKADTVKSGSNSVQTVVKGSDAVVKTDAKDDASAAESNTNSAPEVTKKDPNAIAQDIKQKATKGDIPEAAKQGLETPSVPHDSSNETTLNVNGSKAEVKENQNLNGPAKSKLQMTTLLTTTGKKFNTKMVSESKVVSPANDTNGGFDSSWGKLNVNDWQGSVQGDYYQLTDYTGDANHVIVPNEADFAKAQPVIAAFAQAVTRIGTVGCGQLAKMCNQICIAGVVQSLSEAIAFGLNAGLDMSLVLKVIGKGAAQSWQMDNRGETMMRDQFDFGFAIDWMRKDLGLCLDEAKRNGSSLPTVALVDQFYGELQQMGMNRADTSSLIKRLPHKPVH